MSMLKPGTPLPPLELATVEGGTWSNRGLGDTTSPCSSSAFSLEERLRVVISWLELPQPVVAQDRVGGQGGVRRDRAVSAAATL